MENTNVKKSETASVPAIVAVTAGHLGRRDWYDECPVCHNNAVAGNSTAESAFKSMQHMFEVHGFTRFDIDVDGQAYGASNRKQKTITVKHSHELNEYRVPGNPSDPKNTTNNSTYFTDDRADAIATAKKIHGESIAVKFHSVR